MRLFLGRGSNRLTDLNVVIASPHSRHARLIESVAGKSNAKVAPVSSPEALTEAWLESINPRYIFFPHWSWKIPAAIFQKYECIVFHMTDLPFGRGGSPLQNLVARGFTHTRLSALRCVEEMDAGPIYAKQDLPLYGTAEEILLRAATATEQMILDIIRDQPVPVPQNGEPVVFQRRKRSEGNLAALDELERVYDFVRMLDGSGYPPAFIETEHLRLEFTRASMKPDEIIADVRISLRKKEQS